MDLRTRTPQGKKNWIERNSKFDKDACICTSHNEASGSWPAIDDYNNDDDDDDDDDGGDAEGAPFEGIFLLKN